MTPTHSEFEASITGNHEKETRFPGIDTGECIYICLKHFPATETRAEV